MEFLSPLLDGCPNFFCGNFRSTQSNALHVMYVYRKTMQYIILWSKVLFCSPNTRELAHIQQ